MAAMIPLTPDGLLTACDMVDMPYFPSVEFMPRKSGVVMCYSGGNDTRHTLDKLDRNGHYICICREGDNVFDEKLVNAYPCVKFWFAINCECSMDNVEAMPFGESIGSTQRTMHAMALFNELLATEKTIENDVLLCFSMNHSDRRCAKDILENKSFVSYSGNIPIDQFFRQIYHHTFMISPRGGGVDCCRTWETLYLKSIPIVKRHPVYNHFQDMPIAFVDDWREIDPNWLATQKESLKDKSNERAYLEYWLHRISEVRKKYL
jgi:hypothetical protein